MLGVLLVSSTMGQPQSDPLRLSKRSSMDLRLSKRALTDNLVELDNLPESSLLDYESPLFENMDKRELMENLKKSRACSGFPKEIFFVSPNGIFSGSQKGTFSA